MLRCIRSIGSGVALALSILLPLAPQALAGSAAITVDGNISDLQTAINANLGPADGGLILPNTPGQIGTPACAYFTNGYDLKNVYVLLDYKNADGSVDVTPDLFVGWETLDGEVIGDTDSDGNPSTVNQPISPTGCIVTGDGANISATEEYILLVDFDCGDPNPAAQKPFIPEVTVRISNNAVSVIVNGNLMPINDATFSHRGPSTDNTGTALQTLELRVPDFSRFVPQDKDLCDATVVGGAGNTNEALGEPRTAAGNLNIPPRITISKLPETQALCVGDNANWTLQACNTGLCSFQTVRIIDTLPAGMSYVSSTPEPSSINGQVIEWTFSNVEPEACVSVQLTAKLDACTNPPLVNSVRTVGTHAATGCHEAFDTEAGPVTAQVTCEPDPCVDQVSCEAPAAVCVNQTYTVTGSARNCSEGPEDITITIKNPAGAVIKTQKFEDVPVGASRSLTSDTITCTQPGSNLYTIEAFAENGCGTSPTQTSTCTVVCKSLPCVDQVSCTPSNDGSVCVGQNYTITGSARNCGDRAADLTISIKNAAGAVIKTQTFEDVPAGESRQLQSDPIACAAPGVNQYSVEATATNDCGTSQPGTSNCQVTCRSLPCVDQVSCQAPAEVCVGQTYRVTGSARNCGDRAADLTITIKNAAGAVIKTQKFEDVPAGASRQLESDEISCAEAGSNQYTIEAFTENDCGVSQTGSSSCTVVCKVQPCVDQVSCQAPATRCIGETYTVTGSARNCSGAAEDITITIKNAAGSVIKTQVFEDVPAGQSRQLQSDPISCSQPGVNQYTVEAFGTNDCGTSQTGSSSCSVECKSAPCVDQVSCTPSNDGSVCVGQSYTITGSARNCGDRPADLTIRIKNAAGAVIKTQTFEDVPAGESRQLQSDPISCSQPGVNQYTVEATATNDCGTSQLGTSNCQVTCRSLPCVDQVSCTVSNEGRICVGQNYTVTGSARNCGDRAADLTITIKGPGGSVLKTQTFEDVPAGQSRQLQSDPISCSQPGSTQYTIEAYTANDCGQSNTGTSSCTATCDPLAQVSVVCSSPSEARDGDVITVSGTATNNSGAAEDIRIRIYGPDGSVICDQTYNGVANGESRTLECSVTVNCDPNETVTYTAGATATNRCGTSEEVRSSDGCSVTCPPEGGSCPRTVGFWGAQVAQKGNGSTKYPMDKVAQIAACIDARMDAFTWADDFAGFKAVISPDKPMDCRKQALRQVAGLVANACVGELGFLASNGDSVFLNESSPNPCKSLFPDADTIGDLIDAIDDRLVQLLNSGADVKEFCEISSCADGINNGRGIDLDERCSEETSLSRVGGGSDLDSEASGAVTESASMLELYRPSPNPFTNTTTIAYAVGGVSGEQVSIGIYDVAGRLVRELVNGFQAPGRYESVWNGRNDDGASVTKGVYFLRAYVGGVRVAEAARILYVR